MKIIAIIPIKHHSSRIPGKNYRIMNGKPLFYYILNTLQNCPSVSQIIVDTNSTPVIDAILKDFKNIVIYHRPQHLWGSDVSTNKLLTNIISTLNIEADIYLHTHATNPLLKSSTIEIAIQNFINSDKDSLFTVNELHTRLYDKNANAYNHNPDILIPTQNLDPIYEENSCLYLTPHKTLIKYGRRIGNNPYIYPIDKFEAQDIDWENDFILTEYIMKKMNKPDKTVLITGISMGIGKEIAKKFKNKNWTIIGIDKNLPEHNYVDYFFQYDITNPIFITNLKDELEKNNINKIDVIINNAASQVYKKLIDTDLDEWNMLHNCNVRPIYLLTIMLYPYLPKDGTGSIVNIASVHSIVTSEAVAAYAATKGAVLALTRAMALELIHDNIRVNAVLPGAIDTYMLRSGLDRGHSKNMDEKELINELCKKHSIGRIGKPNEIAESVYFLADHKKSSFIVGHGLVVDGGVTIRLSIE